MAERTVIAGFLLLLSSFFILLLSPGTSFLYDYPISMVDGPVFFTIGKYWFKEGALPYVEMWDMKGPIIYFINGLGYLLSYSMQGIAVIQIICLTATLFITHRLFLERYSFKISTILTIGACMCLGLTYEGGNGCEEFLLPLLTAAYWLFYKWINTYTKDHVFHTPQYAFIYGMVLGFSLLTRLTNALGCMGGVAYICMLLVWNKKWNNLCYNALNFITGFAVVTLPFLIYFGSKDALYEMWYGTFLYNLEYAKDPANTFSIIRLCSVYMYGTLLILYGIFIACIRKQVNKGFFWISTCVLLQLWLANSNGYAHYGILCYPCLCILVTELSDLLPKTKQFHTLFTLCFIVFGIIIFSMRYHRTVGYSLNYDNYASEILLSKIPESDHENLALYNCNPELYYYHDIKPIVPYFSLQDFQGGKSPSLTDRIYQAFKKSNIKWILFKGGESSIIYPILQENFEIFDKQGEYILYKYKHH